LEFRPLEANEIECRIGQIARNGSGLSLLLYKTARVDADILDETFGMFGWECSFDEHKGTLFCSVGVRNEDGYMVYKEDAGAPSNMEPQKGEASDAFKRACFKWGIGRELYTAPRIWVYAQNRDGSANCNIRQGQNGKYQCYDEFSVERIDIRDHEILYVSVRNDSTGQTVFVWCNPDYQSVQEYGEPSHEQLVEMSGLVEELARARGVDKDVVIEGLMRSKAMSAAGVTNGEIRTERQAETAIGQLKAWMANGGQ